MFDWNERFITENNIPVFACIQCGDKNPLPKFDAIELIACQKCGTVYAHDETVAAKYFKLPNKIHNTPYVFRHLTIGTTGKWNDKEFTVIGHAHKVESHDRHGIWHEVLLIDQYQEVYFLNESYGHFTLMQASNLTVDEAVKTDLRLSDGTEYTFFHSYRFRTNYLRGVFSYDPINVSKIKCYDYIAPPYMVSVERTDDGNEVFKGQYLTKKEVANIFKKDAIRDIPQEGVGAAQPFRFQQGVKNYKLAVFIFSLALLVIGITIDLFKADSREIGGCEVPVLAGSTTGNVVTESFRIYEQEAPLYLRFDISSPISQEWEEVQLILINEITGERRELVGSFEYYFGVSDGYSWSEGGPATEAYLSSVEAGKYHLEANVYHGISISDRTVSIRMHTDSTLIWNWLILIIPLGVSAFIFHQWEVNFNDRRTYEPVDDY